MGFPWHRDLIANADSVRNVYFADYGSYDGAGLNELVAEIDPALLGPMREGLRGLQDDVRQAYDTTSFADLSESRQIEALTAIEDTAFFGTVRFLTIAGTFCDPSHGGNQNRVGWKLIGFPGPFGTQPPFGHYDADYAERGE